MVVRFMDTMVIVSLCGLVFWGHICNLKKNSCLIYFIVIDFFFHGDMLSQNLQPINQRKV
jgi:hypothetical protein